MQITGAGAFKAAAPGGRGPGEIEQHVVFCLESLFALKQKVKKSGSPKVPSNGRCFSCCCPFGLTFFLLSVSSCCSSCDLVVLLVFRGALAV